MSERSRRALLILAAAAGAALLARSIDVRVHSHDDVEDGGRFDAAAGPADPATGALLIDLDDDASDSDRSEVARELVAAIAPYAWPAGERALGEEISDEAELYRLTPPPSEVDDVLRALAGAPEVEGVEIERTWSIPDTEALALEADLGDRATDPETRAEPERRNPFRPNDPYYKHQWHLDQIGMPDAWNRTRGEGVVVAVIDTGVAARDFRRFKRAPDLAGTKFVGGWDFVDRDDSPDDEHGHGTHVAGTIAQSTNNGVGVAGVAPAATIMPIRVLDARGSGGWGAIAGGIRWAADNGADVINMSLGGNMSSQTVRRAVDYAHEKGVVIVAAAGNSGTARVGYPAGHDHVIAVGAVRFDEQLSFYSQYGRGLDIVAPGGDLRVDQNGDGLPDGVLQNTILRGDPSRHDYLAWQGTSMAAPHVAGVAALVRAAGVRDPDAVEEILKRTAKSKPDTKRYASGLVQAPAALEAATSGLGGLRGAAAVALGAVLLFGLRRRNLLEVRIGPALAIGFAVAGGLALVPFHALPGGSLVASASTGLHALAASAPAWIAPLLFSVAAPLALAAVALGARRARPFVVGVAVAFGAVLAVEAAIPTAAFGVLPAWLVGPWLVAHALLCAAVAWLAAKRA